MSEIQLNTSSLEINLLQREEAVRDQGVWLKPLILLLIFALGAGITGWLWYDTSSQKDQLNTELVKVQATITDLETQQALSSVSSVTAPLAVWLSMPATLKAIRPQTTAVLNQLKELLPREANLNSLAYTDGGNIQIIGNFSTMENIITFTQEIDKSNNFQFVKLISINNKASTGNAVENVDVVFTEEQLSAFIEDGVIPPQTPDKIVAKLPIMEVTLDMKYSLLGKTPGGDK